MLKNPFLLLSQLKMVVLLNVVWKLWWNMYFVWFFYEQKQKEQHLFEVEIILMSCMSFFDQFNAFVLNKSINLSLWSKLGLNGIVFIHLQNSYSNDHLMRITIEEWNCFSLFCKIHSMKWERDVLYFLQKAGFVPLSSSELLHDLSRTECCRIAD